ncbi:12152_t:CDS:1, partial [Cetraspora pellucida]
MNRFSTRTNLYRLRSAGFSIFHQQVYRKLPVLSTSLSKIKIISSQSLYSTTAGLSRSNIEARIMEILKSFDKVDSTK